MLILILPFYIFKIPTCRAIQGTILFNFFIFLIHALQCWKKKKKTTFLRVLMCIKFLVLPIKSHSSNMR